jgi:ribosomal RNA-processing protein 12
MSSHLGEIIKGLLSWSEESKEHFRLKVKVLFERFIRKFSFEKVQSLVPPEHQKLISSIRKQKERAIKKKEKLKAEGGGQVSSKEERKKTDKSL